VSMKIISYNVRGLGGGEKREEVRRLVDEKKPFVLCIQESKWNVVDDRMIKSIWGDTYCGYFFRPSTGASGGLITVWDTSRVEVWSTMSLDNILVIRGKVLPSAEEFVIVNVYAPIDLIAKREVWERLTNLVLNNSNTCICLCGDFNVVCSREERKGRGLVFRQTEDDMFNKFIADCSLIDLPLCGRLFTWYRGDGVSMSRLDRFLLSDKWCETWQNCI
jgi:exonuclease III